MKLLIIKFLIAILCLPVYPLVLFAEWYQAKTTFGGVFNYKESSADYWKDVFHALAFRKSE